MSISSKQKQRGITSKSFGRKSVHEMIDDALISRNYRSVHQLIRERIDHQE